MALFYICVICKIDINNLSVTHSPIAAKVYLFDVISDAR